MTEGNIGENSYEQLRNTNDYSSSMSRAQSSQSNTSYLSIISSMTSAQTSGEPSAYTFHCGIDASQNDYYEHVAVAVEKQQQANGTKN